MPDADRGGSSDALRLRAGPAVERARAILDGSLLPAEPRVAGSVLLVRDGATGVEVLLLRRHAAMAAAPGMWAFPGGAVEPADTLLEPRSPALAAAVRETAEETGVVLDPALLVPWARWVTPSFQARQFDALFLLAGLPAGAAEVADRSGEADAVEWVRPDAALDRPMLPPTWAMLTSLLPYGSVAEAVAAGAQQTTEAVRPGWRIEGDAVRVLLPGEDGYPGDDPEPALRSPSPPRIIEEPSAPTTQVLDGQ